MSPSTTLAPNKSQTHAQYLMEKYNVELNDMSQPLVDAWSMRPSRSSVFSSSPSAPSSKHKMSSSTSPLASSPQPPRPPPSSASRNHHSRAPACSKCDVSLLPETCVVLSHFPAHWGLQALPAVQGLFAAFFLWTSGCSTLIESYPELNTQEESNDDVAALSHSWPPLIWRASRLRWSWADQVQQELSSLGLQRLVEANPWHFYDAFTHASPAKFLSLSQRVQRLEFLGDAVFTLASTLWMGISDPASLLLPATSFIALRSKLLSNNRLNSAATVFGLHKLLRRRLEAREGVDYGVSPKNVSDSVEALLGAVWCSGGINVALHFAINLLVRVAGMAHDSKLKKAAVPPDSLDSFDFMRDLCRDVVVSAAAASASSTVMPSKTLDSIVKMARSHLSFVPSSESSIPASSLPASSSPSPPPSPPRASAAATLASPSSPAASSKPQPLQFHPSSSDADRVLYMCTIDESCSSPPAAHRPPEVPGSAGECVTGPDSKICSNVFLACLGKAVMDVVVSGHAYVMLGGARPGDLHSWVRVEVLRHERLVDLAEQHNIGPDMAFNGAGLSWNTIVSAPFGKKSVGGSALCATVGCVWLLDVAGFNKVAAPSNPVFAPFMAPASAFKRRETASAGDDLGRVGAGCSAVQERG